MTVEKTVNYTEEMVSAMTEAYNEAPSKETVEALAEEFGKTTRSIVAKLSNLGIYKAQERVTKAGKPIVRKSELVEKIGEALGVTVTTLEKASKQDLEAVVEALAVAVPAEAEGESE